MFDSFVCCVFVEEVFERVTLFWFVYSDMIDDILIFAEASAFFTR